MKRLAVIVSALLGLMAVACGGGDSSSGVDSSKRLVELTPAELMTLCEWSTAEQGGPGSMHECGDGATATIDTVAECVSGVGGLSDTCAYTVAQAESCVGTEPCEALGNADCLAILECVPQSRLDEVHLPASRLNFFQ